MSAIGDETEAQGDIAIHATKRDRAAVATVIDVTVTEIDTVTDIAAMTVTTTAPTIGATVSDEATERRTGQ